MTKRLAESDRRAVDLLLDRTAGAGDTRDAYVAHAPTAPQPGIQSVQSVLNLLEMMPAGEPAPDLMKRALARIDARGAMAAGQETSSAALMTDRPHA